MRAAYVPRYGPPEVVEIRHLPRPVPTADQVLVRVEAAGLNAADYRLRSANVPTGFAIPVRIAMGITGPRAKVLGSAFAGTVTEVGANVTGLTIGDPVAGLAGSRFGTHAEYVAVSGSAAVPRPPDVNAVDAAAIVFGGTTALHFLEAKANVRVGQRVLICGASGAVGTAAVQLAKHAGAQVTAVCSEANAAMVQDLGAAAVLCYDRQPVATLLDQPHFDVVMDCVGALPLSLAKQLCAPTGKVLIIAGDLWQNLSARGNVTAGVATERPEDVARLMSMLAAGTLHAVVEQTYPLERIVEAYRRADTGHKVGNIVVLP